MRSATCRSSRVWTLFARLHSSNAIEISSSGLDFVASHMRMERVQDGQLGSTMTSVLSVSILRST
jgi:hypothetical protein